jgi:hypothetical protein
LPLGERTDPIRDSRQAAPLVRQQSIQSLRHVRTSNDERRLRLEPVESRGVFAQGSLTSSPDVFDNPTS